MARPSLDLSTQQEMYRDIENLKERVASLEAKEKQRSNKQPGGWPEKDANGKPFGSQY